MLCVNAVSQLDTFAWLRCSSTRKSFTAGRVPSRDDHGVDSTSAFFRNVQIGFTIVSLIEVRGNGAGLVQDHQVCDFRMLRDSAMIKMVFPDKFIAPLAKHSYPSKLRKMELAEVIGRISDSSESATNQSRVS